jgi:hypothetical protein
MTATAITGGSEPSNASERSHRQVAKPPPPLAEKHVPVSIATAAAPRDAPEPDSP